MRQWGAFFILVGVIGFFYCSDRASKEPPVPEGLTVLETLHEPAGRWLVGRYVCACLSAGGAVVLLFGRSR